jgi:hypothetical protein
VCWLENPEVRNQFSMNFPRSSGSSGTKPSIPGGRWAPPHAWHMAPRRPSNAPCGGLESWEMVMLMGLDLW